MMRAGGAGAFMKCTKCGSELTGSEKFCSSCGAPVEQNHQKTLETPKGDSGQTRVNKAKKPKKSKAKVFIVAGVVVVLLFACVGMLGGNNDSGSNNPSNQPSVTASADSNNTVNTANPAKAAARLDYSEIAGVYVLEEPDENKYYCIALTRMNPEESGADHAFRTATLIGDFDNAGTFVEDNTNSEQGVSTYKLSEEGKLKENTYFTVIRHPELDSRNELELYIMGEHIGKFVNTDVLGIDFSYDDTSNDAAAFKNECYVMNGMGVLDASSDEYINTPVVFSCKFVERYVKNPSGVWYRGLYPNDDGEFGSWVILANPINRMDLEMGEVITVYGTLMGTPKDDKGNTLEFVPVVLVNYIDKGDHVKELLESAENHTEPSTAAQEEANETVPSSSVSYDFYNVNVLFQELKSNALRANNKFKDQYVELYGTFCSIDNDGKYFSLGSPDGDSIMSDYAWDTVHCRIADKAVLDQIIDFDKNDFIYVRGKVTDVGEVLGIYMDVDSVSSEPLSAFIESAQAANANDSTLPAGDYILPQSSTSYLTESDVAWMDDATLRLAVNEIFARHGRKFKAEDLQSYFNGKSWYKGTVEADAFNDSVFNQYEKANADLIASIQEARNNSAGQAGSDAVIYSYLCTELSNGETIYHDNLPPVYLTFNSDGTATFTGFSTSGVLKPDDEYYYAGWVGEYYVTVAKRAVSVEYGDRAYVFAND